MAQWQEAGKPKIQFKAGDELKGKVMFKIREPNFRSTNLTVGICKYKEFRYRYTKSDGENGSKTVNVFKHNAIYRQEKVLLRYSSGNVPQCEEEVHFSFKLPVP